MLFFSLRIQAFYKAYYFTELFEFITLPIDLTTSSFSHLEQALPMIQIK